MEVRYNLYIHIGGVVDVDDFPQSPEDLLDAIFPDGWDGEIYDVTTSAPHYGTDGYMEVIEAEEG